MRTCLLLLISGYQVGFGCTKWTPGSHVPASLGRALPGSYAADQVLSGREMLRCAVVAALPLPSNHPDRF